MDHFETVVDVGPYRLSIVRPPDAADLIDEDAFAENEFLPYWAELWPSGLALAERVAGLPLDGKRVVELGCGLGLSSLAATIVGADVLATDWAPDAIALFRENAVRNALDLRIEIVDWDDPAPLLREAPWDLVLAADVLYERRNAERLLELLPALGFEVLLADPARPHTERFLEVAASVWRIETAPDAERPRVAIHRLQRTP